MEALNFKQPLKFLSVTPPAVQVGGNSSSGTIQIIQFPPLSLPVYFLIQALGETCICADGPAQ